MNRKTSTGFLCTAVDSQNLDLAILTYILKDLRKRVIYTVSSNIV